MSAFNDYCIVCEQLIVKRQGDPDTLYCSEICRTRDTKAYRSVPSNDKRCSQAESLFTVTLEDASGQCSWWQHANPNEEAQTCYFLGSDSDIGVMNATGLNCIENQWTRRECGSSSGLELRGDKWMKCVDPAVSNYRLWLSCTMR